MAEKNREDVKTMVGETPGAARRMMTGPTYFVSECTLTKGPNNFNLNRNNFDGTCTVLSRRSSEANADFIAARLNAAEEMKAVLADARKQVAARCTTLRDVGFVVYANKLDDLLSRIDAVLDGKAQQNGN